jgi:predicted O-methyltransferase YrrM
MVQARHILEIGTFVGYSALWMAAALPEGGTITTLEGSPHQASLAQAHFDASPYPERFTIRVGMALESLRQIQQEATTPLFDMVFIDASKGEYAEYLALTTPMLRTGGIMAGDNSLLFGHMAGHPQKEVSEIAMRSMQAFNAQMASGQQFSSILLPTPAGLTIGVKLP